MAVGGFVTHYGAAGFFNNNNKKRINNNPKMGPSPVSQAYGGAGYDPASNVGNSIENSIVIGN